MLKPKVKASEFIKYGFKPCETLERYFEVE